MVRLRKAPAAHSRDNPMDLPTSSARAWDFLLWFAQIVIGTVATSIFGGWNAVFGLAAVALVLFVVTRVFVRRSGD